MKPLLISLFLTFLSTTLMAQNESDEPKYAMQIYYFVFLKEGPNTSQDSATATKMFQGHMANIRALAKAGKLKLAGPFEGDGDLAGIFILDVPTEEEARSLVEKDPTVIAGRFTYDILQWYGPKGLTVIPDAK
jgi:uncharacterized protein YciI